MEYGTPHVQKNYNIIVMYSERLSMGIAVIVCPPKQGHFFKEDTIAIILFLDSSLTELHTYIN